jgi:aspartate-semialdehyde dehydrogenase
VAIVGASSIVGKELADALAESPLAAARLTLLDEEGVAGRLAATGDDLSVVQRLDADSFDDVDFVFFAGAAQETLRYWRTARQAGAAIIDLTGALEEEPGVAVRAPWVLAGREAATGLDLTTAAVASAHPAAQMLLAVSERLSVKLAARSIAATVFEPASAHGQAAMDELHQQTVSLLSFQGMPREQFDAQLAFNLLPVPGEDAKVNLEAGSARVAREYAALAGAAPVLALQVVQAPVFHASVISAMVELAEPATVAQVETALRGGPIDVPGAGSDAPSNVSAAGQSQILVRVSAASPIAPSAKDQPSAETGPRSLSTRFWLWMAADNLKLTALNAIACAGELSRLRPSGKVQ